MTNETYQKYKGKNFIINRDKVSTFYNNSIKIDFKVVGYLKTENDVVIGLLNPKKGVKGFTKVTSSDYIEGHVKGSSYVCVKLSRLDKYLKIRDKVKNENKTIFLIDEIKFDEE